MKAYQKPAMLVLSISANDMLCSGCDHKLRDDPTFLYGLGNTDYDTDSSGQLERNEVINLFAASDITSGNSCGTEIEYNSYCKFTGSYMVAWS